MLSLLKKIFSTKSAESTDAPYKVEAPVVTPAAKKPVAKKPRAPKKPKA